MYIAVQSADGEAHAYVLRCRFLKFSIRSRVAVVDPSSTEFGYLAVLKLIVFCYTRPRRLRASLAGAEAAGATDCSRLRPQLAMGARQALAAGMAVAAVLLLPPAVSSLRAVPTPSASTIDVEGAVAQARHCCNGVASPHLCPGHVPDIPARTFMGPDKRVRMIVGSTSYFPMSGPSPLNQTRSCKCSFNKTADPNPADYAANEYLDSPIAFPNGTVVSLVHTEFPGNKYNQSGGPAEPYCTVASYPTCWTVSIGLAVSHDWGLTFSHPHPPPRHLVAAVPYRYNQSQLASGWGDPSNILRHPSDGFYYAAIWNRHQVGAQAPGICIIRTRNLLEPSSWRAWDGSSYSVAFADAYTLHHGTESKHVCTVTNLPAGSVENGCAAHGLFWSAF
eukprot:SAG31_NODE_511_length_14722_cov_14.770499_17_plen_390_part_01